MAKRKLGRPPKAKSDLQTEALYVRLTFEEKNKIEQAAGGRLAAWARAVLLRAADRAARKGR